MAEFEVKLEVPAARRAQLAQAFTQAGAVTQHLRAIYYDTPGQDLRRCGVALRLRQEGDDWVQTAKAPTDAVLSRLEHNAPVQAPAGDQPPALDLTRHEGSPVAQHLAQAAGSAALAGLAPWFETDVQRSTLRVDTGRAVVEVTLDQGEIRAKNRSRPVCELEVELKDGDPVEVLAVARRWCTDHELWLSTISKAEQGQRLADGIAFGPAVMAQPPRYPADAKPHKVASKVLAACLDQVLGNASEIATGSSHPDHIHQLRVGLRRLRTALKDLKRLTVPPKGCEEALTRVFRGLGDIRDRAHVVLSLEPRIEAAGGPVLARSEPQGHAPDPQALVRDPKFQDALLALLGAVHGRRRARIKGRRRLAKSVARGLEQLRASAMADGERFLELDEARQHRVRKHLKRLRYMTELVAPLYGPKKAKAYVDRLKPAQEALGTYNDEVIALESYRALARDDPKALFAVGWLSAKREADAEDCARTLRKLAKVKPYWR